MPTTPAKSTDHPTRIMPKSTTKNDRHSKVVDSHEVTGKKNGNYGIATNNVVKAAKAVATKNNVATLPQTGEHKSNAWVVGLLLSGLALFGLAKMRKKN